MIDDLSVSIWANGELEQKGKEPPGMFLRSVKLRRPLLGHVEVQ